MRTFLSGSRWLILFLAPSLTISVAAPQSNLSETEKIHLLSVNRSLLRQLQFYTCQENIDRFVPDEHGRPTVLDTVEVDVGVGRKHEMYSWPGDANFSPLDLGDLVGHGLLATGLFGGLARDLFFGKSVTMKLEEPSSIEGQKALRFNFAIPSQDSHWQIVWNGQAGQLGEAGQFWVSAADYHLIRLSVEAVNIPPQVRLRSLSVTLDYVPLSSNLVPDRAVVDALDTNGEAFHNAATFSHCHVFEVDSKLLSSDDAEATLLNEYASQQPVLPAGLILHIKLKSMVYAHNAMVGESIEGRLQSAVKVSQRLTLPEGSVVKGRVRRFERVADLPNTYLVGMSFSEVEGAAHTYRFLGELRSMQRLATIRSEISRISNGPIGIGLLPGQQRLESGPTAQSDSLSAPVIPGATAFFLTNTDSIPAGLEMVWRTKKLK